MTLKTNADWIRKAKDYSLLPEDDDDEDHDDDKSNRHSSSKRMDSRSTKNTNSSSLSKKERLKERKKRRRRRHEDDSGDSSSSIGSDKDDRNRKESSIQNRHRDIEAEEEGRDRQRRRRRSDQEEDEEDDEIPKTQQRMKRGKEDVLTKEQRADLEREQDLRERDEFVQRMLERDKSKTKHQQQQHPDSDEEFHKETKEGLEQNRLDMERRLARGETVVGEDGKAMTLDRLRVESRRAYLKKRQEREVTLLKQSLQDEEELFRNQKLTVEERKRIELGRKIIKMVESNEHPEDKNDGFYRLPDDYNDGDTKGNQDQALLSSRYIEPVKEKSEQELWEDAQTMKALAVTQRKQHHKKKTVKEEEKEYDLVFDEQIDFVMQETAKGYDKRDKSRRPIPDPPLSSSAIAVKKELEPILTEHEKILAGRKKLPVYPYREEFLAAVKEHQVLVLVGETGSGKVCNTGGRRGVCLLFVVDRENEIGFVMNSQLRSSVCASTYARRLKFLNTCMVSGCSRVYRIVIRLHLGRITDQRLFVAFLFAQRDWIFGTGEDWLYSTSSCSRNECCCTCRSRNECSIRT